jgi:transcriptional antiterminator RfaH
MEVNPLRRIDPRWYLVRTKQHKEKLVLNILTERIANCFLPFLMTRIDHRNNAAAKIVPLFPCYVFAFFDLETQYHSIQRTPGVNGVVCAGGEPSEVDESIIEEIKNRGPNGVVELPRTTLEPGQSVNIRSGPLRGISAVFERYLSGAERAALLVNFISGASVKLILPAALVEPTVTSAYRAFHGA